MKLLRTLPTGRLLFLLTAAVFSAMVAVTAAVAVAGGGGSVPRSEPLAQALHGALTADKPSGVSARITFTNHLLPTSSLAEGRVGSALISGASGRLWITNDGRGRVELQSDAGDVQVVWNSTEVSVYDASSNTVYRAQLPAHHGTDAAGTDTAKTPPSVADIESALTKLAQHADVSGATPTDVAGQPAYSVRVGPKDHSSLLGDAELAWDAIRGVPLRIGVYARGAKSPVLELALRDIQYGSVSSGDVSISPPANATVVDLTPPSSSGTHTGSHGSTVDGLAAVQAAANFPVTFPDSLAGRTRAGVHLVGKADSQTAIAVYGDNLGSIVVAERKAGAHGAGPLASLPTVTVGGHAAHELSTPLATALQWDRGGVSYVVGGSVTPAVAETAAADLG